MMRNECNCCGKKQYSAWDRILGQPKLDRMEANFKLIMDNHEKLQAAAKESDEALIRAIEEL